MTAPPPVANRDAVKSMKARPLQLGLKFKAGHVQQTDGSGIVFEDNVGALNDCEDVFFCMYL